MLRLKIFYCWFIVKIFDAAAAADDDEHHGQLRSGSKHITVITVKSNLIFFVQLFLIITANVKYKKKRFFLYLHIFYLNLGILVFDIAAVTILIVDNTTNA